MGLPILLMGKSGAGKSAALRNFKKVLFINVNKKPLPFQKTDNITEWVADDIVTINAKLPEAAEKFKSIVIDDAGYLMVKKFMAGHRGAKGNNQFDLYNDIADSYYNLIQNIVKNLPNDVIVYVVMHEEKNEYGDIAPKTIGKLLNDKVNIEGMFTIVLRALKQDGHHVIATQTDGNDVTKTPMGMFKDAFIDNDLQLVDDTVREYYNEPNAKPKPTEEAK